MNLRLEKQKMGVLFSIFKVIWGLKRKRGRAMLTYRCHERYPIKRADALKPFFSFTPENSNSFFGQSTEAQGS